MLRSNPCTRLVAAMMLAGIAWLARGGDYLVKTWEVDDGLPESAVTEVAQTAEGYLWVGTLNSGLSRFDGARFVNFDSANTPQLAGRGVRRLLTDPQGTLWINGFGNYLASWRADGFHLEYPGPAVITWLVCATPERIVFATQEGQLLEGTRQAGGARAWKGIAAPGAGLNTRFFEDQQGGLWYRRADRLLVRLDGEHDHLMFPVPGNASATAITGDDQGVIAIGTTNRLFIWDGAQFQDLTPTNGEADLSVAGIVSDGHRGWWVEANNRLRRCEGRRWIAESAAWKQQQRTWGRVRHEQPDHRGGVWLNYLDAGLIHVSETGVLNAITTHDGLPSNTVRNLFQDREDNLWVSFERSGLVRVRPRRFDAVGKTEGLADTVVTSVCEDRAGAIWIGTIGGTVARYESGRCTNFTLPQLGTHCEKAVVCADPDGRVWIGTQGDGVFAHDADGFHQVLSPQQVGVRVRGLLIGRDERVWVASQDGLFCLAGNQLQQMQTPAFEEDYPTALAEGTDGAIWAGMNSGGLLRIGSGAPQKLLPDDATLRRRFSALHLDADGTIWIGTSGAGLLHFSGGRFRQITTADGLPSDTISQVLEDAAGELWFGSPVGVFSVPKAELAEFLTGAAKMVSCRMYGRDDGLPTLGCAGELQPTAWHGHDGRLWFATDKGVTCLQPGDSGRNTHPPPVIIEAVRVDGKPYELPSAGAATLDIPPGRHQLAIDYTGLSFTDPDRVRFKYTLEGLDRKWTDATETRTATYSSVPAGEYHFRVSARNSDGVWSENEATLGLSIRPHVWETWWFRGAALAGLLAAVGGGVWAYERRRARRRLEIVERQQALERERVRVARDLHDDLGAGLTEIGLLGALARRTNAAPERVQEHLSHITDKAREMVTSLDEIVWSLNPKNDSLASLSRYFCEYAQQFLQLTPIRCRMEVAEDLPDCGLTSEQRHHLLLAFKEALTNVVRHAQAAEVRLGIAVADGTLIVTVKDDGQGLKPAAEAEGIGGLANLSRRLDQIHGRCELQGEPGRGTTVRLILPLPKVVAT